MAQKKSSPKKTTHKATVKTEKHIVIGNSLMGVLNKTTFFEISSIEISRSRRHNHPFTMAYIILDHYEENSRKFGKEKIGKLLLAVAKLIRENIRLSDYLAFIEDKTLALMLPETANESFVPIINKIRLLLSELTEVKQSPMDITFSFGSVTFIDAPDNLDILQNQMKGIVDVMVKSGREAVCFEQYSIKPEK